MSLKVGQYCKIKNDLIINKKYGTVTYNDYIHTNYLGRLLKIQRVTNNNTACCYICEDSENITKEIVGTFSESMLDFPKFEIGNELLLLEDKNEIIHITKLDVRCYNTNNKYNFIYWYKKVGENINIVDCIYENILSSKAVVVTSYKFSYENLNTVGVDENLNTINVNGNDKNRLQEQETNLSGRDRLKGRRIQGRTNKVTISSKPLRNPKSIRGK